MKNTATNLLEKMGLQTDKIKTFVVNGEEFTFEFDQAIYDNFINDVTQENKITPVKEFLQLSIAPEHREKLDAIINAPMVAMELFTAVQNYFVPKINITLKN